MQDPDETWQRTIDLAELARINRGDRVEVGRIFDSTQDLFEQTLALVDQHAEVEPAGAGEPRPTPLPVEPGDRYVPENADLRAIYRLAEAVGGYEAFHDLVNVHSPGSTMSRNYGELAKRRALTDEEVRHLREYQDQIHAALSNANTYLRDVAVHEFDRHELHELHEVILAASERSRDLTEIMGAHLMHEIERSVERLYDIHAKMRNVEQTINGIFIVDSEVMFIPGNELIRIVNTLFEAVGNSYLSRNVDGVMLLAARNLLIEVTAFYSYYGKHQIYSALKRGGATVSSQAIARRIRFEIRKLFDACKRDNKLVLIRVMKDAERQFEISVGVIQQEAEESAVEAVQRLIPAEAPSAPAPKKKGLLRRLVGWLTG